ncbi:hypothetical protein [Cellulomonas chengniuliangii]|uniref:hypothetical protein n=1 Tax=Cellulomonas chengniuliangii TaxID=2968084 RepID=UPI001D0DD896|nr:hypothetical protein [Cellulomonas chengniuliangii]MCC2317941.1 hypothetical protein [Cellulomonas chengniuliangii]
MDTPAGLVTLAVVGLWGAYLMPHRLRHRQQLVEARIDDRHSGALRVLAVADRPGRRRQPRKRTAPALLTASADCSTPAEPRVRLLTPGRGLPLGTSGGANGGMAVDRPHGTQDRISADKVRRTAQHRAAHAAAVARRGAAARRRAALAFVLLVASAVGWAVAGLTAVTVLAGVAPTVLLGSVLVLGRRAVLSGRAADAEWERRLRESALPPARATPLAPAVTGRAVHPSDAHTEVFARILDTVDGPAEAPSAASGTIPVVRRSARAAEADAGSDSGQADAWSPVPVPRPTYTLKAAAPHREPAPLGDVEGSTAAASPVGVATQPATTLDADGVTRSASTDGERQEGPRPPIEQPATTTGSMNLDEILARRRAVGE